MEINSYFISTILVEFIQEEEEITWKMPKEEGTEGEETEQTNLLIVY